MAVHKGNIAAERGTSDRRLEAEVRKAILYHDLLRSFDLPLVIRVHDGRVRLEGAVCTEMMKRVAAEAAGSVPGIQEVQNELVSDTELELQIAQRLARDPRTRLLTTDVTIQPFLGTVHLRGRVGSSALREAAAEVTSEVKGVRQVVNELIVED